MMIWEQCQGMQWLKRIHVDSWRVVEDQYSLSARDLVDSREEHDLLEALLEDSKPSIEKDKNYLIFTPFRYPPLKYGSRFSTRFEPSLWYGALSLETAFAEVAYYRLKFFQDSSAALGYVEISMTAFTALIETEQGIDLTEKPFSQYTEIISNPSNYEDSQRLGSCMRESEVHAFIYYSARSRNEGINIAAFTPTVFKLKNKQYVNNQQHWKCVANNTLIEFTRTGISGKKQYCYSGTEFNESTIS